MTKNIVVPDAEPLTVEAVHGGPSKRPNRECNSPDHSLLEMKKARMIAAFPDMLKALKDSLSWLPDSDVRDDVIAAIRKAEPEWDQWLNP